MNDPNAMIGDRLKSAEFQSQWDADFANTMQSLEAGIVVRLIMSAPLVTVEASAVVSDFLDSDANAYLDCFPVRDAAEQVIGAVYRHDHPDRSAAAEQVMRPLYAVPIVSSAESVDRLMRRMHETGEHYWLVVHGSAIAGIVTRSDLGRLPVRMLLIMRIIHLEELLKTLIRTRVAGDTWLNCLSESRQAKLREVYRSNQMHGDDLDLLECTYLSDKATVARKQLGMAKIEKMIRGIDGLRNQLMHARDGKTEDASISKLLERVVRLDKAIELLQLTIHNAEHGGDD